MTILLRKYHFRDNFSFFDLDSIQPRVRVGSMVFAGQYQDPIGTSVFFQRLPSSSNQAGFRDEAFGKKHPETGVSFKAVTRKMLCLERVLLIKKDIMAKETHVSGLAVPLGRLEDKEDPVGDKIFRQGSQGQVHSQKSSTLVVEKDQMKVNLKKCSVFLPKVKVLSLPAKKTSGCPPPAPGGWSEKSTKGAGAATRKPGEGAFKDAEHLGALLRKDKGLDGPVQKKHKVRPPGSKDKKPKKLRGRPPAK